MLAFIIPWGDAAKRVRAAWFCLLAWRLRRRLERETGARVLVYVGRIERSSTFSLIRKIRATPPTRRLELVLDTMGGEPLERARSKALVAGIIGAITAARVHRGEDTAKAQALAERLTMAPDHGEPRFFEDVQALGLKVRVDADQRWGTLVMWTGRSRSP